MKKVFERFQCIMSMTNSTMLGPSRFTASFLFVCSLDWTGHWVC